MSKAHIGDVLVHLGEPAGGNPYRGQSLLGQDRKSALSDFKNGEPTPGLTFWFAPGSGGARRIEASEVDWETSGVE